MKSFAQITGTLFLAAILSVGLFVFLREIGNQNRAARSVIETGEEAGGDFARYSGMALLAASAPDEKITMPVKGIRTKQIADTFGAARSGGRNHKGQDIFAKKGTPVYSATDGYVLRVGESDLGGKIVFVLGAGGRRYYYAHLDGFAPDLKTGAFVTKDSLIGYVGTTGNAKNTPPHLHFGVYGAGGAIDPLTLLVDRTQSGQLSSIAGD